MKSKISNNISRKPITRLAFLLVLPALCAATCQGPATADVLPIPSQHAASKEQFVEPLEQAPISDTVGIARVYTKEELLGRFEPSSHPDFEAIGAAHTTKSSIYLQRAAYDAFKKMHDAAKSDGITLTIISATRNFQYQKGIWEKKWKREKYRGMSDREKVADILKYSSMPGTSRHHWGTDVDFNAVELAYWQSDAGSKVYAWLVQHASAYGFYQTYTDKTKGRSGYEEEKWHWSYMPIAREMHRQYRSTIAYADITGFSGSKEAESCNVFLDYVDGIAPELLPK